MKRKDDPVFNFENLSLQVLHPRIKGNGDKDEKKNKNKKSIFSRFIKQYQMITN